MKNIKQRGLIKMIILIVIALIVLGALGFNLKDIVSSEKVQANLNYVWGLVVLVWNNYLAFPFIWIWNNIVVGIIWHLILIAVGKV